MKKTLATSLLAAGGLLLSAQDAKKPNIVLFMVDDMGWQDTSVPFWTERTPYNDLCHTPNMERLASQGVKFTNAYACAISSPTRTSLMTGMNTARHRVSNWTLDYNSTTDAADSQLGFPYWNFNGLQPEGTNIPNALSATNLAQLLKNNGYFTIHAGKAHWGSRSTAGANPLNLGFDVNIAGSEIGGLGSYYGQESFGTGAFHVTGLDQYHGQDINITEALTLEAIKAVERRESSQPFYLYMSHYSVHVPIQIDNRFKDNPKYAGYTGSELAYLTMLEGMDKSLGDLLNWIDANGEAENTIVIFMSDNGGHNSVGSITVGGVRYPHQYPLRGAKGSVYEGGVREPMIVKWPGVTQANTSIDKPVIIEDFFPSMLEMAGITNYSTTQTIDGVSFVPLLKNEPGDGSQSRSLIWHFPNRWGESADGSLAYSSVLQDNWKFIYRWHTGDMELYNLNVDISEANNLLLTNNADMRNKAKNLAKTLSDYLRSVDAQRPVSKASGVPVLWPDEAKMPTLPVQPQISDNEQTHWYKIYDNRSQKNFWQIGSNNRLDIATEAMPNDTVAANKLFKLKLAPDGSGYQFFSMLNDELPVSSATTGNNVNLFIGQTSPVNSWLLTPSLQASGYYLIAAETDNRQLNSYHSSGFVSFWMPATDNDPGNRWAFIPGFLLPSLQSYPEMNRFFTNVTVPWEQAQSRFLVSAVAIVNGVEQKLIDTNTNPTNTALVVAPNVLYPNAVVDARLPQIELPYGIKSFGFRCLGSTINARNLQYAQQNVFIDWNRDFDFLDANEAAERSNSTSSFPAHVNQPGFERSIQIPDAIQSGVYRMRVVYHEPEAGLEWKNTIWNTNTIRNGIAYDFDLKIETQTGIYSTSVAPRIQFNNGRITVNGRSDIELFTVSGISVNPHQVLKPGFYLVKLNDAVYKVKI